MTTPRGPGRDVREDVRTQSEPAIAAPRGRERADALSSDEEKDLGSEMARPLSRLRADAGPDPGPAAWKRVSDAVQTKISEIPGPDDVRMSRADAGRDNPSWPWRVRMFLLAFVTMLATVAILYFLGYV